MAGKGVARKMILQMIFSLAFLVIICYTLYKIFQLFSSKRPYKSPTERSKRKDVPIGMKGVGYPNQYIRKGYKG